MTSGHGEWCSAGPKNNPLLVPRARRYTLVRGAQTLKRATQAQAAARARRFAHRLISSKVYRDNLRKRVWQGSVHPSVEQMLWHYAAGKPPEKIDVSVDDRSKDLHSMTREELATYLIQLQQELTESADAGPPGGLTH